MRGTAVGFVENNETEIVGRDCTGDEESRDDETTGDERGTEDEGVWALAKREDKRTKIVASWKMGGDILGAVVAVGVDEEGDWGEWS